MTDIVPELIDGEISDERLQEMLNHKDIDFSDIPDITPEEAARAVPGRKIYLDCDVATHFHNPRCDWERTINEFLRKSIKEGVI